jgi:trk system potassium uptake protein TrkA
MKIVILGCGRLGERVAKKMEKDKANSVIVMDKNANALNKLGKEFSGQVIQADGTDMQAYTEVMKEKTDLFIAITSSDNTNIMAAEIAKQKYKAETAIARVDDPIRAKAFEELGILTFCPTTLGEKKIAKIVEDSRKKESEAPDEE